MSLYILHPVVVGSRTCCNDQIVITEATDRRFDLIFPGNDPGDPGHAEMKIRYMPEIFSERKSNRAGVQAGCRHLIEQRLELVIIVLVDQYKLKPTPTPVLISPWPAK